MSQQHGSNGARAAQTGTASTGDSTAGSQIAGAVGSDLHQVQLQNTAECVTAPCAVSGEAIVDNTLEDTFVGPSADTADGTASVAQIGDDDAVLEQSSEVATGDAVFGSQVTGTVGGSADVMNSNASVCPAAEDPCAESGQAGDPADPTNEATITVGPFAVSAAATAQGIQTGDDSIDATQTADASSGDALSGSQVTGLVSEEEGHLRVSNQQASEGDFAQTDEAFALQDIAGTAGVLADGGTDAMASQIGDDAVTIDQTTGAITGDAVAGSQITGAVAGDHSEVTIANQNAAGAALDPGATALSGPAIAASQVTGAVTGADSSTSILLSNDATGATPTTAFADFSLATNDAAAIAGPIADAPETAAAMQTGDDAVTSSQVGNDGADAEYFVGPVAADAVIVAGGDIDTADATDALSSQLGDDGVTASQENVSGSGNAVAGSQITGSVSGDGSDATVSAQNTADDPFATSGTGAVPAIAIPNDLDLVAGPTAQAADSASAQQAGDDTADVTQSLDATTGDAVSGSQVTGIVGAQDVVAQMTNATDGGTAASGVVGGPANHNTAAGLLGPQAAASAGRAQSSQAGDTGVVLDQELSTASGDAIDGAQVTGRA
jgi:hypothetical protein